MAAPIDLRLERAFLVCDACGSTFIRVPGNVHGTTLWWVAHLAPAVDEIHLVQSDTRAVTVWRRHPVERVQVAPLR